MAIDFNVYAFDCGTTNWRISFLSCQKITDSNDTSKIEPLGQTQPIALTTFSTGGHFLPAALLLNGEGKVLGYGQNAYDLACDPENLPYLRDAFKLCIGNDQAGSLSEPSLRYSHQEALGYTQLLLSQILQQLDREKPDSLAGESGNFFLFAHPVHWGRELSDGTIEGQILADFAKTIKEAFPTELRKNIHFVPEPEGALLSLMRSGQLTDAGNKYTLVVDVGGGTTDFVAGQWTSEGLQDIRYYGGLHGGGLFDHNLAEYLADVLKVPYKQKELAWSELRIYGQRLKETLSRQVQSNPSLPVTKKIVLELPGEDDESVFLSHKINFTISDFENQAQKSIADLNNLILRALLEMDLRKSDIAQVVLVGGGSHLYLVPQLLKEVFGNSVPVVYDITAEQTVVQGVALWLTRPKPKPSGWAAILYDFNKSSFITIPEDFTPEKTQWALKYILGTLQNTQNIPENPRWSLFKDENYCVVGITCRFDSSNEKLFVGYVAHVDLEYGLPPIISYSSRDIKDFKPLSRYTKKSQNSQILLKSNYQRINYSEVPKNSNCNNSKYQLNFDIQKVWIWIDSEIERKNLWLATAQYARDFPEKSVSLCIGLESHIDALDSLFLNGTVTQAGQTEKIQQLKRGSLTSDEVKITILGASGAGQRCYLLAMYAAMRQGIDGFALSTQDLEDDAGLTELWKSLIQNNWWPACTCRYRFHVYNFNVKYLSKNLANINWLDCFRSAFIDLNYQVDNSEWKAYLLASSGILLMIDGNYFNNKSNMLKLATSIESNQMLYHLCKVAQEEGDRGGVPVCIVITKYDLVQNRQKQELIEDIKLLFNPLFARNSNWLVSIVPVSLGKELSLDCTQEKIEPINVHLPILFMLYGYFWYQYNHKQGKDKQDVQKYLQLLASQLQEIPIYFGGLEIGANLKF